MRSVSRRGFLKLAAAGLLSGCAAGGGRAESGVGDAPTSARMRRETLFDREDAAVPEPEQPSASEVTIGMVGDILVHRYVWLSGEQADGSRNYDALFEHVKADIEAFDIAILDQETILGGQALGEFQSFPTFNSPQEFADAEVAAGFDVFLKANNHAMDQGMAGIQAELAYWRERFPEALVTGMADSAEAAAALPILERAGHKIAILSYTSTTNGIPLPEDAPWAVNMLDEGKIASDFAAVREAGAEAIIACPHCGTEYAGGADGVQRHWAGYMAEQGADVVMCNHPHVLQPFEWVWTSDGRRVPVFWSLGNFVSAQVRMDTMVGGLAHVTLRFEDGNVSVAAAGLTPLVEQKAYGPGMTTYKLCDYTEELAAANVIRGEEGNGAFSRQWCVDLCAARLGEGFDPATCEFTANLD